MSTQLPFETAPDANTWDLTPPRRPGLPDVNNAQLLNDGDEPPPDMTFPTAALLNTDGRLIVAAHKTAPGLIVTVDGSQNLVAFQTPGDEQLQRTDITVTGVTAGQVDVTWPSAKLPLVAANPIPAVSLMATLGAHNYAISAVPFTSGSNVGFHVYTVQDGALAYLPFSLTVW